MKQINIGLRHEAQTLHGMRVVVCADNIPKMQLSARVCEVLKPEFIVEMNAWMIEFFGFKNLLADGEFILDKVNNIIHMNPRSYQQLKKATENVFNLAA